MKKQSDCLLKNVKRAFFITGLFTQMSYGQIHTNSFDSDLGGWEVIHTVGSSTNVGWSVTSAGVSPGVQPFLGTGMIQLNCYNIFAGNSYELNSPLLNFSGEEYQLRFQMYRDSNMMSNEDNVEVFYNTIAGSSGGTSLGVVKRPYEAEPVEVEKGWHEYTFVLPENINGAGYISLVGTSTYGYNIYIDEVVVEEVPTCIKPTDITFSNITPNSVEVSWEESISSSVSNYEYYYSLEDIFPNASTTPSGTSTELIADITNLQPNTDYFVWVRSVCSANDKSDWSIKKSFKTACGVVTANYIDGFDNVPDYGEMPYCWTKKIENPQDQYGVITTSYLSSNPDDYYIKISNNSDTQGSFYIISPKFSDLDNDKQISIEISKKIYNTPEDDAEVVEIGIITDPEDTSTYTVLKTIYQDEVIDSEWTEFFANTTAYTVSSGHIAIKYQPGTTAYHNYKFNNFKYQEARTCPKPTNTIISNVQAFSADVSWTALADTPQNGYEYYYATTDVQPNDDASAMGTSTSNTVTVSNLESSTNYFIWVRSVCGDTDKSYWSNVASFTTNCAPYTIEHTENFDNNIVYGEVPMCWNTIIENTSGYPDIWVDTEHFVSAPNAMRMYNSSDISGTYYLVSPKFSDLNSEKEMSVQVYRKVLYNGSTATTFTMEVGIMTDAADTSTYQMLQEITSEVIVNEWQEVIVGTENYTGNEGHLVIKYKPNADGDYNKFYFDDFIYRAKNLSNKDFGMANNQTIVYPNPFQDILNIDNLEHINSISISDTSGKTIKSIKPQKQINLGSLNKGVYLINLSYIDGSVKTIKAIKK